MTQQEFQTRYTYDPATDKLGEEPKLVRCMGKIIPLYFIIHSSS